MYILTLLLIRFSHFHKMSCLPFLFWGEWLGWGLVATNFCKMSFLFAITTYFFFFIVTLHCLVVRFTTTIARFCWAYEVRLRVYHWFTVCNAPLVPCIALESLAVVSWASTISVAFFKLKHGSASSLFQSAKSLIPTTSLSRIICLSDALPYCAKAWSSAKYVEMDSPGFLSLELKWNRRIMMIL